MCLQNKVIFESNASISQVFMCTSDYCKEIDQQRIRMSSAKLYKEMLVFHFTENLELG